MRLAVVIPTLDEERELVRTVDVARRTLASDDLLIVSDGGSADRTVEIAEAQGAIVVRGSHGRGPQLERGAQEALRLGAGALLFLHADTLLPGEARERVVAALGAGAVGGGFLVAFDAPGLLYRVGERLVNLRTRALRVPLGDQAQFASAEAFLRAGGFPAWPILEDVALLGRLRRAGRLAILRPPVITSARRFARRGVLRTVATNWWIWLLFLLGARPERLVRLYRREH